MLHRTYAARSARTPPYGNGAAAAASGGGGSSQSGTIPGGPPVWNCEWRDVRAHACHLAICPDLSGELTFCYRFRQMSDTLTSGPEPDANLGYLLRLAHQRFRSTLEDALHDLGLSAHEYVILSVFETRPELSTSELARLTQVTRQTMHTAVLELETAGLIERRPKNQRVVLIRPTKRGRMTLAAATARVREVEQAALAGLSRTDERVVRTWLANTAARMPSTPRTVAE